MGLLPQHAQLLRDSAISDEVAEQRGYFSVSKPGDLNGRFPRSQRLAPALVVPIWNAWGEQPFCQLRPDTPRTIDGRTVRYETPRASGLTIDVPPAVRPNLGNPKVPLIVTEGARKADAAVSVGLNAVNLLGVSGWKGKNASGGITALDDWNMIALNGGRPVFIAFDSDAMTKAAVHAEVVKLGRHLERRGADVKIIYLPHGQDGAKTGLDDFVAAGHSRDDLLALASDKLRPLASDAPAAQLPDVPLRAVDELLGATEAFLRRYVVLSEEQYVAVALWVAHCHALAASGCTIYLHIVSPEYESGKTRLLEVLAVLVPGPLLAANVTTAVLYRAIEKWRPVLLLDEADNLFGDKDSKRELFGVLNAGYRRGMKAYRTAGANRDEVEGFETFCAKAIAGLDDLIAPLASRCLRISMQRRRSGENVEDFDHDEAHAVGAPIRDSLAVWADCSIDELRRARPTRLGVRDRLEESLRLPLGIADEAGEHWRTRAREALLLLSGVKPGLMSEKLQLLSDIRTVFDAEGKDELLTAELLVGLLELEESPWRNWWGTEDRDGEVHAAKGAAQKLAGKLRSFEITSCQMGDKKKRVRGYLRADFEDAWERYLPADAPDDSEDSPEPPPEVAHPAHSASQSQKTASQPCSPDAPVSDLEHPENGSTEPSERGERIDGGDGGGSGGGTLVEQAERHYGGGG